MPFIYTFSTGSTEVYDASDYSAVDTLQQVSLSEINRIGSVYNLNYQKIFAGPAGGTVGITGLTIYDSGNTKTVINISADTFAIAVDNTNDLVAITNTSNFSGPPDNIVVIVDASSDTVVNTVNVIDSYKGDITSDNNGYCYVVGSSEIMTKVDIVNGVTADTINIGDGTSLGRRVIFNPTNGYIYTLNPYSRIRVWDSADNSLVANISLTANTGFYVYNPDNDYIYVGDVTGVTNDFVITTIRCSNNTKLSQTFIYSGASIGDHSSGTGMYGFYSTDTQYLYVGDTNSDSILVLTT